LILQRALEALERGEMSSVGFLVIACLAVRDGDPHGRPPETLRELAEAINWTDSHALLRYELQELWRGGWTDWDKPSQ
jgi:hypothetical protein